MSLAWIAVALIVAATALACWRVARASAGRRAARIALQGASAVLLYFALFPPMLDEPFAADTLVVWMPGITDEQMSAMTTNTIVALPGVPERRGVERAPDLGTALRRHATASRLRIVGGGLPARDRDAAQGLAIEFDAAPLPDGVIDLHTPIAARAGSVWTVGGRAHGYEDGRVELRDPAGAVVARAPLDADGAFELSGQARAPGRAMFALRLLDGAARTVEEVPLPIDARGGDDPSVLLIAGAPDPDLKYLRRWASDAGVRLVGRMALSDGVAMRDGDAAMTREALAATDLAIVDERGWKTLDAAAKGALIEAVRAGLGLLLRITGPLPDGVAADWQALGFRIAPIDAPQAVTLASFAEPKAELSRRTLSADADRAAPLLRAADGTPLALWRGEGQGRIGAWWLADSYKLALAGDAAEFGTLWSDVFATLARARGGAAPELPADARVDRRSVVCGIDSSTSIERPDGSRAALVPVNDDGRPCAAYWPAEAGWHVLDSGASRYSFYVRGAGEERAQLAAQDADATRQLAGATSPGASSNTTHAVPAPRWPLFVAWLAIVSVLWWLERGSRA